MPVKPEIVEFPFNGGIDTKSDEKTVTLPSFLDIKNGVFSKQGSIVKRTGYTKVNHRDVDETALASKTHLSKLNDELVAFGDGSLHSYSSALDYWVDKDTLPAWSVTDDPVASRPATQSFPVHATDGSIYVTGWLETNTLYVVIKDANGSVLAPATALSTVATEPQILPTDNGVALFFRDTTTQDVCCYFFTLSNLAGNRIDYGISDFHSDYLWSVGRLYYSGEYMLCVVYKESANQGIRVFFTDQTGDPSGVTAAAISATPAGMSCGNVSSMLSCGWDYNGTGSISYVWILFGATSDTRLIWFDATGFDGSARTVDASRVAEKGSIQPRSRNSGNVDIVYEVSSTVYSVQGAYNGTLTPTSRFSGMTLASKLMHYEALTSSDTTNWVFLVHYSSTLQNSFLLINSDFEVAGVYKRGLAAAVSAEPLPHIHLDGTITTIPVAVNERVDVGDDQTDAYTQANVELLRLDVGTGLKIDSVEFGDSLYVGGSSMWQYDGASVYEAGFWFYPELSKATFAQNTQTIDTAISNQPFSIDGDVGTLDIIYYVVYEFTDATGKRIQSAAAPITFLDAIDPGTQSVTFTIPQIPATRKSSVRAAVYRTHSTSTAIAYRIADSGGSAYPGVDVSSSSYSFTDDTAEADLKAGEILYISSGELENVAPEGCLSILSHDDRIFYVPSQEPLRIYYSKRPGDFDQPGFNEGLYIQAPPDGGDITGLATIDNKIVIFKRDRVFLVSGTGPNNLGVGSYSQPRLVSTDTGCKNRRSIVRVPQGVMFQSDKGIYWLNRGEAVNYIGAPAEAYNSLTVEDATILPDDTLVIFLVNGARTLAFDYEDGLWTTFTGHAGLAATVIDDTYYYLRADGIYVYKASSGYQDAGQSYSLEIETPWIRPEGLQARWHIRRAALLGNYSSDHNLDVDVYFNYRSYKAYTSTWDVSTALDQGTLGGNATLGGGDLLGINDATKPDKVYQVGHLLRDQRVQAVKFLIREVPPATSPGASFELTGLAAEVAGYGDTFKLPGSKTI